MKNQVFKISPSRSPFKFHAWLELPFPLSIEVNKQFTVQYKSFPTTASIVIGSGVYKVSTGSFWQQRRELEEWASRIKNDKETLAPNLEWILEYVSGKVISKLVRELENDKSNRYVHVDEIPAVVHVTTDIPHNIIPTKDFSPDDLFPQEYFITEEVFPKIQSIIDAYRIAAYPWMRYSISPIIEKFVDEAIIRITDKNDEKIGDIHERYNVYALVDKQKNSNIQARFDRNLNATSTLHNENRMAYAYYLCGMRRWAEAITLASAAVDDLSRKMLFQIASDEIEAEAIWKDYRYKYRDLFNEVFPRFGKPKLSETHKELWDDFVEAKSSRGAKVHGENTESFDKKEQEETKRYLAVFYDVALWITQQMGCDWALECHDEDGKRLDAFP